MLNYKNKLLAYKYLMSKLLMMIKLLIISLGRREKIWKLAPMDHNINLRILKIYHLLRIWIEGSILL
jgi:hypothetical protein